MVCTNFRNCLKKALMFIRGVDYYMPKLRRERLMKKNFLSKCPRGTTTERVRLFGLQKKVARKMEEARDTENWKQVKNRGVDERNNRR